MKEWQSRAKKAEKELEKLKASTTLKAGKALLYIPKKLKHVTGKKQKFRITCEFMWML